MEKKQVNDKATFLKEYRQMKNLYFDTDQAFFAGTSFL